MEPVIEISKFETSFGNPLEWKLLTDKQLSRINFNLQGASVFIKEVWHKMFDIMFQNVQKFKPTFK